MRQLSLWTGFLVCSAALAAAGCGDDDVDGTGGTGATGTGGSTGGGATGGGGTGGSAGGSGGAGVETVAYELTVTDFDTNTIEGAGVAIDMMDGTRFEGTTDVDGVVTIDVPVDVEPDLYVAHKDGYNFVAVPFALYGGMKNIETSIGPDLDTSGDIQVSGNALNMADAGVSNFFVAATPGTIDGDEGATAYDLLVPPSTDFTLGAFETSFAQSGQDFMRTVHNVWFGIQSGVVAPATIDIDFADPAPASTPFAVSFTKPADATLATTGLAYMSTFSANGPAGGSTTCTHDGANGEYDCVGFTYDNGAATNETVYIVADDTRLTGGYGRDSVVFTSGGPPAGLVDLGFVNAPDVLAPSGAGPHPLDTPVEYSMAAGGGSFNIVIGQVFIPNGRIVGVVVADQMGGLRVPELPSTSDPNTQYEASMDFLLFACRNGAAGGCEAIGSEMWEVSPPAN